MSFVQQFQPVCQRAQANESGNAAPSTASTSSPLDHVHDHIQLPVIPVRSDLLMFIRARLLAPLPSFSLGSSLLLLNTPLPSYPLFFTQCVSVLKPSNVETQHLGLLSQLHEHIQLPVIPNRTDPILAPLPSFFSRISDQLSTS